MVKPEGKAGDTLYVRGLVPPEPVTGVNDVAATLLTSDFDAIACVAATAEFTAKLKLLLDVVPPESVTLTV